MLSHAPTSAARPRGVAIRVVWLSLVGFVLGEALEGGYQAVTGGGSVWAGVDAASVSAGLVLLPGLVVAALLAMLLSSAASRALGTGLAAAVGDSWRSALVTVGAAAGVSIVCAFRIAPIVFGAMSPGFASVALAGATLLVSAIALLSIAPITRALTQVGTHLLERLPARLRGLWPLIWALSLGGLVLWRVELKLGGEWVAAPLMAMLGATLGLRMRRWPRRVLSLGLWLWALAFGLVAPSNLEVMSGPAQRAVLYRAPYVALVAGAGRKLLDSDHDGYARALLGGDCDDTDAAINPAAHDEPGDGVDQNCSGQDASVYTPPPAQRTSIPTDVPHQPNIVLVLIDALRPDHMSSNGYARPTTPHLDAFAAESVVFERAYSPAPSTRYAMASLFTGLDARRLPHQDRGNDFTLLPAARTLTEQIPGYDEVGYTISYVVQHNHGTGQGFRSWTTPWPTAEWAQAYGHAADLTNEAAHTYLEGAGDDHPYLLFLHYRCTHDPFVAHAEWPYGDTPKDRYDSALSYCDDRVGAVLDELRGRPDWDRTAVFVFSDHGELFGEHGLTSHGNSLYEPDVRIVLMGRVPGATPGVVTTPVQLTDLAPTLLELTRRGVPDDLDGRSLLPAFFEPETRSDPGRALFVFTKLQRGSVHLHAESVIRWPLKFIRDQRTGTEELYDLAQDPGELSDLSTQDRVRRSELAELLDSYSSHRGTGTPPPTTPRPRPSITAPLHGLPR